MTAIKTKSRVQTIALSVLLSGLVIFATGSAASIISTNVQTDGNVSLTSATSSIMFANGWTMSQTAATTTEITLSNASGTAVVIFDDN